MPQVKKNKMRVSITVIPFINEMLEKISKRSGMSKSLLVEQALKQYLQEQLDKDSKALAQIKFEDLPSEDEWLLLQSK